MQGSQVVWPAKAVAAVEPLPVPAPKENEALVRTRVTLISQGTERAWFLGLPGTVFPFPGPAYGYSNVGEIVALGAQVSGLRVGQRVACGAGHLSHFTIDAASLLPVPDTLPDEEAVFFNLVTIALQGVRKGRVELGEPVVVIGAGLIGLFAMQLAKLQGALPAVVIDKDPSRAAFARQVGADAAFTLADQLADQVQQACAPAGPAVVIEATGSPQPIVTAFKLAKRFGRVVLLGSTRGETEKVDFCADVHRKGLTIIGAQNGARPQRDSTPGFWTMADDWRTSLKLLEARRLQLRPLLTHRFAAADAPQAYDLLAKGDLSAQAMILDWT